MEISNRHADAKVDRAGILSVMLKLTDPASLKELEESLKLYPDELFASQGRYPADYLAKWDAETQTRRLTGVAANDCHHNQVLIVKMVDGETVRVGTNVDPDDEMHSVSAALRPGIRALTKGHKPGDVLARLDIDPYHRSFRNLSTHILAPTLDEASLRSALRDGHAYVSHDWMCDHTADGVVLLAARRRAMAHLCLHDAAILSDTFRDNLFAPNATNSECWEALAAVELDGRIEAAGGLDTWIEQDMLSLGEAQRLNLARALLCEAPLVLLDEPVEHLDPEQGSQILKRVLRQLACRIVVYSSHDVQEGT